MSPAPRSKNPAAPRKSRAPSEAPPPRGRKAPSPKRTPPAASAPGAPGYLRWLLAGAVVLLLSTGLLSTLWLLRPHAGRGVTRRVTIAEGADTNALALALYRAEVIDRPWLFAWFAWFTDAAETAPRGEVLLRDDLSPRALLRALARGTGLVRVTIPEGYNRLEVAARLVEAHVLADAQLFLSRSSDAAVIARLGFAGDTLEGYLYPDTYELAPGASEDEVLERMTRTFRRRMDELRRRYPEAIAAAAARGLDERALVTLASMVEKETGNAEDRPRIAGVFWNRLRLDSFTPHLLQSDPTIVFGCRVAHPTSCSQAPALGRVPITRAMLDDASNAYNTYRHEGLPPGPIANPGARALEAVLAPTLTGDLYFVAMGNGHSAFARTRAEHEANVQRYLRGPAHDAGRP